MVVADEVTGIGNPGVIEDDISITVATPEKRQPI